MLFDSLPPLQTLILQPARRCRDAYLTPSLTIKVGADTLLHPAAAMPSTLPAGSPQFPLAPHGWAGGGGGAGPGGCRKAALPILGEIVLRSGEERAAGTNLPLLELLPCQEAPARCLEEGDVPAGLCIPLLLQPGQ